MAPPSQRYRQIGFLLEGGKGPDVRFDLTVRPEDMTVAETSRLIVQQTLGGAWADAFDRGLVQINLSGTLGWRGGALLSGEDAFAQLRNTVFTEWHLRRADAIAAGDDPATVRLTFIDTLDGLTYIVAPQQFVLRRSKSRPLLMTYQLRLVAIEEADAPSALLDQISAALSNPMRWLAGRAGLTNTLARLQNYLDTGMNLYGQASSAVRAFVGTGTSLLGTVNGIAGDFQGVFSGLNGSMLATARAFSQAGGNALAALSIDGSLPDYLLIPARRLPSLFVDADCTMANSFSLGRSYPSYDDVFGASLCSSTGGGRPASIYDVAGTNPFDAYFPAVVAPVGVSAAATQAMQALRGDPLLLRGQDDMIASNLSAIAAGVSMP